ncbi:hypothetical protein CAL28_10175 [Bordetella genomosp. 11]|uniref:HTH araC/xylS-type domain-containing protein n=2 Tax=Bordetella genomosp. 11 TaxID=1416808 RepID=A0A261UF64_9BORD|nr:hypothetical protein CAL28_10175 [Bordetella genomosp. 11]
MASTNESGSQPRKAYKLEVGALGIERAQSMAPLADPIDVPVASRTAIIVQNRPFPLHRLWRSRKLVYQGSHKAGGISITNLEEEWRCHHLSAFDNFRIQIDHERLRELAAQSGAARDFFLRNPAGKVDRTMQSLVNAIAPALERRSDLDRLYIDHIASAMMIHIISTYGGPLRRGSYVPTLGARRERRIVEYMRHHVATDISVEDIAAECGISAGHFTKAFFQSTGLTPHQWILRARVDLAKDMLRQDIDIASIANSCGFSDQSHFSRVFKKLTGVSPARWRKN